MTRIIILKADLGIFLKSKTYPKKGMSEGGRQEKLPFHSLIFYLGWTPPWKSSEKVFFIFKRRRIV